MATLKDIDVCMPELKKLLHTEKRKDMRAAISFAIDIFNQLPVVKTEDCVPCKSCFFYNEESHMCAHRNGLTGRVKPEMFCSYGSLDGFSSESDEELEIDFSALED